jgi:hypothetical protein
MVGQILKGAACALAVSLCALSEPVAQSSFTEPLQEWERDWTVLTMAPDGAWGTATEMGVIEALAHAISNCRAMSGAEVGCGAHFTTIRAGWSLGSRCGEKNIIVAELNLDDAELRASWREYELRQLHDPDMPPCVRVVTVDPNGDIVAW